MESWLYREEATEPGEPVTASAAFALKHSVF